MFDEVVNHTRLLSGKHRLNHKNAEGKKRVYGYLHGWLSGPDSYKGRKLKEYLANLGVDLKLLDLKGDEGYAGRCIPCGSVMLDLQNISEGQA